MNFFRRQSSSRESGSGTPISPPPPTTASTSPPAVDISRGRPSSNPKPSTFASRSRSRAPAGVPAYLHAALTDAKYLKLVLSDLSEREKQRGKWMRRRLKDFPPTSAEGTPKDPQEYYSIRLGMYAQAQGKNRYTGGIVPYDHNLVLPPPSITGGSEYVNASWVRELHGGKWWIAAQAPVPSTVHPFLSLCCAPVASPSLGAGQPKRRRVQAIVVLTRDVELRIRKADPYIPPSVGESVVHPPPESNPQGQPIKVTLLSRENLPGQVVLSKLEVNGLPVEHWCYEGWPDHGVPLTGGPLLGMIEEVDDSLSSEGTAQDGEELEGKLAIVHCSAGIGRTGTWIALCSLLRTYSLLRPVPAPTPNGTDGSMQTTLHRPPPSSAPEGPFGPSPLGTFPPLVVPPSEPAQDLVAWEVDSLRDQRTGMVQRDEQVLWVYQTLRDCLIQQERERSQSRGPGEERGRSSGTGEKDGPARGRGGTGRSLSRLRGEGRSESRDGRKGRGYADMAGWSEED